MSDNYTVLNPGVGGDVMDETGVTYATAPLVRKRPRVVITGEGIDDIVDTTDLIPAGTERGLVTKEGTRGQQTSDDSIPVVMAADQSIGRANVVVFQQTIGTSQAQLSGNAISLSVTVKSLNTNTGVVYVGVNGVTASNGFELGPGESISLAVDDTSRLYAIADSASQKLCVIGI